MLPNYWKRYIFWNIIIHFCYFLFINQTNTVCVKKENANLLLMYFFAVQLLYNLFHRFVHPFHLCLLYLYYLPSLYCSFKISSLTNPNQKTRFLSGFLVVSSKFSKRKLTPPIFLTFSWIYFILNFIITSKMF